ncbi:MAG: hypothetical protein RLZZ476_2618, partial [Verrucomicrobiota bacterium]
IKLGYDIATEIKVAVTASGDAPAPEGEEGAKEE